MSVNGELETSSIATYTTAQTMSGVPGQFADAEDDSTPSSATPEVRQDGRGYIDDNGVTELGERDPVDEVAAAVAAESAQSARIDDEKDQESEGSSVEEERDSDDIDGGWPSDEEPAAGSNPELIEGSLSDEEALDWGVEDEDWELADGDFTKQYNRARQTYSAASGPSGGPSRPLPARNAHVPRPIKAAPATAGTTGKALVNPAAMAAVAANPKKDSNANQKDKADRATHEQVLDSRTRLVLGALVNRGFFGAIDGCVSTGKEANVYLAFPSSTPPPEPSPYPETLAVKIYRTSILNFRSRQNYIVGEHRFRGGYASAKNPRKMVRLWAEKELRNLRRLVQGGIRAPIVIEQRENVLVMEFLGDGSNASPRLKDAEISKSKLPRLYAELLVAMRRMYHACHLVHADLSEYNILYHNSHLYIIDVSQSVEHDHPSAFDFLRSDIRNVEDFFVKRSNGEVKTLGLRRAWSFIVDEDVGVPKGEEEGDEGEDRLLDVLREWLAHDSGHAAGITTVDAEGVSLTPAAAAAAAAARAAATEVDDAVFFSSYIPRSLGEVYDPERDTELLREGKGDQLIYAGITKLNIVESGGGAAARGPNVQEVGEEEGTAEEDEPLPEPTADSETFADVDTEDAEQSLPSTMTGTVLQPAPASVSSMDGDAPISPAEVKHLRKAKGVRFADEEDDEALGESADADEDTEGDALHERKPRGFRHEDKESKKERKKALKEENREKRKVKMPKGEKQRLIKKSSGRG